MNRRLQKDLEECTFQPRVGRLREKASPPDFRSHRSIQLLKTLNHHPVVISYWTHKISTILLSIKHCGVSEPKRRILKRIPWNSTLHDRNKLDRRLNLRNKGRLDVSRLVHTTHEKFIRRVSTTVTKSFTTPTKQVPFNLSVGNKSNKDKSPTKTIPVKHPFRPRSTSPLRRSSSATVRDSWPLDTVPELTAS